MAPNSADRSAWRGFAQTPRIQSVPSVPDADFPDWWAKHRVLPTPPGQAAEKSAEWWAAVRAGVYPPDSIPGAIASDLARMGALTGDPT